MIFNILMKSPGTMTIFMHPLASHSERFPIPKSLPEVKISLDPQTGKSVAH